ncbi:type I-E CRISPR-associated protein Cas6/Cse3/CasE [Stutzerimonas stutzeri]|uniref:type I-E CRISPR-associated protein Cas6/Cse3/CasE n=1 Tax=Stutzerimonas stutzeri TaxID=316 RepID=UPI0015E39FD5|nr:type I-E CRISPR-associated protein Cas6/Cse3/CasE [Stutzerimonas stutzeri]MBA1262334.1 type I-E CRISPR-associated protein Cas6/Cse3/CasE [Stutzerimonas stutzeri]
MRYHFSRVRLLARPSQSDWLRDLARHGEPYRDHALIWKLFPGDGLERDFVFRRMDDEQTYYVVSARPPQQESGLFQIDSKPYLPQLEANDYLRFDLRANPVVSRREPGARSQRHDVLMDAKRRLPAGESLGEAQEKAGRDWVLARAEHWGLMIEPGSLLQDGYRQHRLKRKGHIIEYSSLDYQGVARVVDPERLRTALLDGVGHAKGFGCGLLLAKRLV